MEEVFRQLRDILERLERLEKPDLARKVDARVFNSVDISITTSGVAQALTFDSERWDTDSFHEGVTNPGRLTIPADGAYILGANIRFDANATGVREVRLRANGSVTLAYVSANAVGGGSTTNMSVEVQYDFVEGDYVEVVVLQTSGGALNVKAVSAFSPEFWAVKVG